MRYWKEAATVILAARFRPPGPISHSASIKIPQVQQDRKNGTTSAPFDYKILMLQRTHQSSFFAGAQVFPGGGIDEADFSPQWLELFAEAGIKTIDDFGPMVSIQHDRPQMMAVDRESPVPSDIAFRICAIRETFEESGVLLLKRLNHCRSTDGNSPSVELHALSFDTSDINIETNKRWRQRIHKNAAEFLEMCRELKSFPDVWALAEWSNWLTPSDMSRKRYDTMFYLCCMETLPLACQDESETIHSEWVTPSQSLAQFVEGKFFLPPPQVYEFQRLCGFPKLSDLFKFNQQRALLGCQLYLPVRVNCSDGVLSLLPGLPKSSTGQCQPDPLDSEKESTGYCQVSSRQTGPLPSWERRHVYSGDYLYPERPALETVPQDGIMQLEGGMEENTDVKRGVHRQMYALSRMPTCRALCSITLPHGHCPPTPFEECVDNKSLSKL